MTAKSFLAKIEAIAATTKKTEKLGIIKTFNPWDRKLAQLALDPTITYYIAKLPPAESHGTEEFGDPEWELLTKLMNRELTGNAALEAVKFSLHDLAPEDSEVLRRIILKDLRAGIGANSINTVFPGDIPDFAYMRCSLPKASNIDKWDWSKGVFCQLKADGSFARVSHDADGNVRITTRQGNTYPDIPALRKLVDDARWVFPAETETHGELTVWVNGELQQRSIGNGMLNSLQQGGDLPEGAEIRFDCWDQIPLSLAVPKGKCTTPYAERFKQLEEQVTLKAGSIMMIESQIVHSKDEALRIYRSVLARRLEGVILKSPDMEWADHTSKNSVKFKLEVDLDLKIVGFNPGEPGKRTEATFGSVKVQSDDGELEADVAGFTRELEDYIHNNRDSVLGTVMCVRANALAFPSESNPKHSLYHPRVVELRDDKYRPDSLDEVKAQFEAAIA